MKSDIPASVLKWGEKMGKSEMAPWEAEREHILKRLDQVDKRFDKVDSKFDSMTNVMQRQNDIIDDLRKQQNDQIDKLTAKVFEIASDFKAFNKEFKIKTSSWVFLGFAITLALGVIGYLIKNQLV